MTTTITPEVNTESKIGWKEELKLFLQERLSGEGFARGEISTIWEMFSESYGVPLATVRTHYYKIKNELEQEINTSDDGVKPVELEVKKKGDKIDMNRAVIEETLEPVVDPELEKLRQQIAGVKGEKKVDNIKKEKRKYHVGDEYEIEITAITTFGAFVKTNDEYRKGGLIHISQIADQRIDFVEDYFEVGDILKAKISKYDSYKDELSFSTVGYPIPKLIREAEAKKEEIANKPFAKLAEIKPTLETKPTNEEPIEVVAKQATTTQPKPVIQDIIEYNKKDVREEKRKMAEALGEKMEASKELEQAVKFINDQMGFMVTPEAEMILHEAMGNNTSFEVAIAMNEVKKRFSYDPSVAFVLDVINTLNSKEGL